MSVFTAVGLLGLGFVGAHLWLRGLGVVFETIVKIEACLEDRAYRRRAPEVRFATDCELGPGCCPFVRSGGFHGQDCNELGRGPCRHSPTSWN
jgi:hypothetical protein